MTSSKLQKNLTTNLPKLRFKHFDGDWVETKLGDLFIERDERSGDKQYDLLSVTLNDGIKKQEQGNKRDGSSENKSNYKVVHVNDIAYNTMRMWQGASGVCEDEGIVSPAYTVVTLRNGDINFFKYLFKQKRTVFNFYRYSQGMTSDTWNLKFQQFAEVLVTIPSSEDEQRTVSSFLGAVDLWIENLKKEKELLKKYKKGLAQDIFTGKIRFKDTTGKTFPDWKEVRLGDVVTFCKGKGISKDAIVTGGKNKCIRYGELYTTYSEVIRNVHSRTDADVSTSLVSEKNDLLVPSSGETAMDIARISCLNEQGVLLGGDITVMRLKEENHANFFAYYLTNFKKRDIAKLAQGHTVVHLYSSHLRDLVLKMPTLIEQKIIADCLEAVDKLIQEKEDQISLAATWRHGLIQKLFI